MNDPPNVEILPAAPLVEGTASGRFAGSVVGDDPEGQLVTYTITGGNGSALFSIDTSGTVLADGVLDYETTPAYQVEVSVSDGVNSVPASLTVQVADVDEAAPVIAAVPATVNEAGAVTIGISSLYDDPEGEALVVQGPVVAGANSASVTTDGASITYVHNGSETVSDTIDYLVSDPAGNTTAGQLDLTVTPLNDAPALNPVGTQAIAENQPAPAPVVDLVVTDPDGPDLPSFDIVSGDAFAEFEVTPAGRLQTTTALDRETRSSYSLVISVTDGVAVDTTTVNIVVTDADEPPLPATIPDLTVDEGATGTSVDIAALHVDPESQTLTIVGSSLSASNQASLTTDGSTITYEHDGSETVNDQIFYVIEDPAGNQVGGSVAVVVIASNDPPQVTPPPSDARIDEGLPAGQVAFTIMASDVDGPNPLSYSIVAGDPSGRFTIAGDEIRTTAPLDHEGTTTFDLQVEATDGVATVAQTYRVIVDDINEAPEDALMPHSMAEAGTSTFSLRGAPDVPLVHNDPENDTLTISLDVLGANGSTTTDGSSIFYVHDGTETTTDRIEYTVSDLAGNSANGVIELTVTPTNDRPVIAQIIDQDATVGVEIEIVIPITDEDLDNQVTSATASGLPAGLASNFDPSTSELTISGTVTALSFIDTSVSITVGATDDGAPALGATPMTFDLVFADIAISPFAGTFVVNEILYAESEKYDPADPLAALVMDEFVEFRNNGAPIDVENWYVSDTKYPLVSDDFDFHGPGAILPGTAGRIFQAFTQPTPIASGGIVTAPLRRPTSTRYELFDGSTRPASTYQFRGTAYGFPPGPSSNWEAFNDSGDDFWLWDNQDRLVAYVAWDDGTGTAHIAERPDPSWGLWDPADEARLAGAAPGQSISLAGPTPSTSCWELTGTGTATCAGNFLSRNIDDALTTPTGRISSQGRDN